MEEDEDEDDKEEGGDLVHFVTGLLLSNDANLRSWIANYIRSGHRVS